MGTSDDPRLTDPRLRAIGISWFAEEDYAAIRSISEDGHKMPGTWKEWLKGAEEMEQKARSHPPTLVS